MEANTQAQARLSTGPDRMPFYSPLMPFERALLSELQKQIDDASYAAYNGRLYPISMVFEEWKWARSIKIRIEEYLGHDGETLIKEYGGNRTLGFNALLQDIGIPEGGRPPNLARIQKLRNVNECFLSDLSDRAIEDVEIQPWLEDLAHWETLSIMWQHCGQHWKFEDPRPSEGFVIFELIRKFTTLWRSEGNMDFVDLTLLQSPQFMRHYEIKRKFVGINSPDDMTEEQMRHFKFEECHIKKKLDKEPPKVFSRVANICDGLN
ncbi:hypothetical protein CC80DRAFT_487856 [Byssothecium circinans]|uniref:Uncharacterized protein n=1 Tax=Byssothecium circinans TaxID=147558 RepID=A0A6A5UEL2_9PLEO|nr:hypothetical protein CC80DRAFT_487856 [Byssothecium circinans]